MILKLVPRDHVEQLPVPKRIKDYLKTPNYYSETYIEEAEEAEVTAEIVTDDDTMPNNEPSETIVEAAENTNEMYLDANSSINQDQVPTSNVQVDCVGEDVGLVEAGGQEDQQDRVSPM